MSNPEEPKKGFLSKVGAYAGKRFMPTSSQSIAKRFGEGSIKGAMGALKPKAYEPEDFKAGLHGRYADGGKARFNQLIAEEKLSDADLGRLAKHNTTLAVTYGITAIALLCFSLYCVVVAQSTYDYILAFANFCVFLALGSLTVRHDFNRWQIQQRAFPGFRAYIDRRW